MPNQRFTVYDVMEAKGVFEKNPANIGARTEQGATLYNGPVQYPKMVFHPQGEERIIVQAEIITTPLGPKAIGEQRELIYKIVNSESEEEQALKDGWHSHPSEAIAASGKDAPSTGAAQTIAELERQIALLKRQKDALESRRPVPAAVAAKPLVPNPLSRPA
jgi:hypothetical protein